MKNMNRQRENQKSHYLNNKEKYVERNRAKGRLLKSIAISIKEDGCMDCGVKYPPHVLDFDHRDPSTKKMGPAQYRNFSSAKVFMDELAKCDVVCANCHREREHQRRQ